MRLLITLLSFLLVTQFTCKRGDVATEEKVIDLSTPEKTLKTYLHGYITGNKMLVAIATGSKLEDISNAGLNPPIVTGYKILEKTIIEEDHDNFKKGDVIFTTEEYFVDKEDPPIKMKYVLRKINNKWIIIEHWYIPDENYRGEDPAIYSPEG